MGSLYGVEDAEVCIGSAVRNLSDVSVPTGKLSAGDAFESGGVALTDGAIGLVLRSISGSDIFPSIVCFVEITVVYLVGWPFPGHVEKGEPMLGVFLIVNFDEAVSFMADAACSVPDFDRPILRLFHPSKPTCDWVIRENFGEPLVRQLN